MPYCPVCSRNLESLLPDRTARVLCPDCYELVLPVACPTVRHAVRRVVSITLAAQLPFVLMWLWLLAFADGMVGMGAALYVTPTLGWGGVVIALMVNAVWSAVRGERVGDCVKLSLWIGAVVGVTDVVVSAVLGFGLISMRRWGC